MFLERKLELEKVSQEEEGYCDFSEFPISERTVTLLKSNGIVNLFPIQSLTYKHIYEGKDLIGRAMTGQGKTLAFVLPIVERMGEVKAKPHEPLVVVLTPTRELAKQIASDFETYGSKLRTVTIYGGVGYEQQERPLRNGVEIVVGKANK